MNERHVTPKPSFSLFHVPSLRDLLETFDYEDGLSIYEDDRHVYVEAAVPGIDSQDIEITFKHGQLQIHAQSDLEEEDKVYYRRARNSFSYSTTIHNVNESIDPKAECRNGMLKVIFDKMPEVETKKIKVEG